MNKVKIKTQIISSILILVLLMIFGNLIYDSYHIYRETIVDQQQQHLLTIAQSLKRSIEMYFADEINNLTIMENSSGMHKRFLKEPSEEVRTEFKKTIKSYYDQWDLIGLYLVDPQGQIRLEDTLLEGENYLQGKKDFSKEAVLRDSKIRPAYQYKDIGFIIPVVLPIYEEEEYIGAFIAVVSLEDIYDKLIGSTTVGEKGYVMVKDSSRNIIMHPVKEQIGNDIVKDRKEEFPEFYYGDLENLEARQYTEEEGVAEYYSYWWNETPPKKIKKIKKISSFTRINLGGTFWVLAVVMDYSEIVAPIQANLIRLLSIGIIVFLVIMIMSIIFIRLKRKQEALLVETKYLKNINYTLKELQASERKIMHYQKLETLGTFTGGLAHELNNLLTPILGYSELATYTMSSEDEYYDDMKEISAAALQAKDLIQQISLLSRKGKLAAKSNILNISKKILKSIKMIEASKEENITIIKDIQPDCGYIECSKTHIQQILNNLCNNGCQAMKDKGGTLTVRLEKIKGDEKSQVYACLTVEDTGCGIKAELLDRIYDPFFTTKEVGEGTGIGLSIVQGIVRNYKGKIYIESEEGKGTKFKVLLPVTESKPAETEQVKETYILDRSLKILLVEDDGRVIRFLEKSLIKMGYDVTALTNPHEALEHFRKEPSKYSLLITDYAMPNLTGTKLISEIKNIRPDIKIILITGVIEKEVLDQIKHNVIDDFIIKPVENNDLSKKIYTLFKE